MHTDGSNISHITSITRWTSQKYTLAFYGNSQPIFRLHARVICHKNGNFVGFQNSEYAHLQNVRPIIKSTGWFK